MEYILSDKQRGCFLCGMVHADTADDRANLLLHRGERAFLALNLYPYNNGHLMAASYHHVGTLEELSSADAGALMAMTTLGVRILRRAMEPQGFNVGINIGKAAGAGLVEHLHVHIVPRWNGDTNFMPVMAEVRTIPQHLWDTYDELKAVLAEMKDDV
jgi:ATP adenylyltransferase